jgi:hypothetical protein
MFLRITWSLLCVRRKPRPRYTCERIAAAAMTVRTDARSTDAAMSPAALCSLPV